MKMSPFWGLSFITAFVCVFFFVNVTALEEFNDTAAGFVAVVNKHGKVVYMTEGLAQKLKEEEVTWHWTPWLHTRVEVLGDVATELNCVTSDSVESFPDNIFTDEQLRQGAFLLFVLFGLYSFTLLTIICNDYFIPCVELICEELKIPQNVAAATFMSVATSCPEFFVNVISTFLTESDMGIGTIIGSAVFNALGVAAIGGLAAAKAIDIEFRPVTRDVIIYMFNVSVLVAIVWDGQVDWIESLVLGILYIIYFIVMFNSTRMFTLLDKLIASCTKNKINDTQGNRNRKSLEEGNYNKGFSEGDEQSNGKVVDNDDSGIDDCVKQVDDYKRFSQANGFNLDSDEFNTVKPVEEDSVEKPKKSLFRYPSEKSVAKRIWWVYTWPVRVILTCTIPSPVTYRKFYSLSFIMCIVWIGVNSYFVSWSMTVIGHTFMIPDSVMGMTFLAFGGCLPEACSIFIMSRRGEGGIGVSNALGANSLAILFAVGLPWLIRTLTLLAQGAENPVVLINSAGIEFIVTSILLAVISLWIALFFAKFQLKRSIGAVLGILYVIFITFAILTEMGILFDTGVPC